MEFRVLGPVQLLDGDRVIPVASGSVRALLAVLLLHANHIVTVSELVDYLWGEVPPAKPRPAIQTYVMRLRRILGHRFVRTEPRGYLIELDPTQLDLTRFRRLVDEATRASGPAARAELFRTALELWQDQPLANINAEALIRSVAPRLMEERLHAEEQYLRAQLELGQNAQIIAELTTLTTENPLRERFWAQLMLALYRCGRQSEALAAYHRVSRLLADDLGIDPGEELQCLHQLILTGDPGLAVASPADRASNPELPRQLPPNVRRFPGWVFAG